MDDNHDESYKLGFEAGYAKFNESLEGKIEDLEQENRLLRNEVERLNSEKMGLRDELGQ